MKLHHIGPVTYVTIEDHDLEILKTGGACQIKDRYFVLVKTPDIDLADIKVALDLDKELILTIHPEQIPFLEEYNFISYTETLRLSLLRSFEDFVKNNNFKVVDITCAPHNTLQ